MPYLRHQVSLFCSPMGGGTLTGQVDLNSIESTDCRTMLPGFQGAARERVRIVTTIILQSWKNLAFDLLMYQDLTVILRWPWEYNRDHDYALLPVWPVPVLRNLTACTLDSHLCSYQNSLLILTCTFGIFLMCVYDDRTSKSSKSLNIAASITHRGFLYRSQNCISLECKQLRLATLEDNRVTKNSCQSPPMHEAELITYLRHCITIT